MITAPPRPAATESDWRAHQSPACDWSWTITGSSPGRAVCVRHDEVFDLPTPAEAYELQNTEVPA